MLWRPRADFTDDEWKALEKGVTGAGMLVSVSDADFTDAFGEASALAKALASRRDDASELVRELAKRRGTGFGLTASAQEVETETLASLRRRDGDPRCQGAGRGESVPATSCSVSPRSVAEAKGGVAEGDEAAAREDQAGARRPDRAAPAQTSAPAGAVPASRLRRSDLRELRPGAARTVGDGRGPTVRAAATRISAMSTSPPRAAGPALRRRAQAATAVEQHPRPSRPRGRRDGKRPGSGRS